VGSVSDLRRVVALTTRLDSRPLPDVEDDTAIGSQLSRRRSAAVAAWDLGDELVLIGAGAPIEIPGRGDVTYPFRAHSEYFYLTDRNRPNGVLAFDPQDGWFDFVEPVTAAERLWSGASVEDADGLPVSELARWLEQRLGRPVAGLGEPPGGVAVDSEVTTAVRRGLDRVRRVKDPVELQRMRKAERATRAGFAAIAQLLEEGTTERAAQIELEAELFRAGATGLTFDTVVAGGPNSAVLHFAPTARPFQRGDLVLVDAGGEYLGYASDVTRTYAIGPPTQAQQELRALVRAAGLAAMERCTDGTEFRDVHRTAARVIAEGLVDFGLLRGDPDALVGREAASLFFPHSVGHMVGLGARDAGGSIGRPPRDEFPRLRIDLPLCTGYTVTIEPGVYFVPALLLDEERRAQHRDTVNWELADRMLGFGGIRIEDNVLVQDGTFEVLTADVPLP
jgi:Xaa-Pro aminopeptidase